MPACKLELNLCERAVCWEERKGTARRELEPKEGQKEDAHKLMMESLQTAAERSPREGDRVARGSLRGGTTGETRWEERGTQAGMETEGTTHVARREMYRQMRSTCAKGRVTGCTKCGV